MTERSIVDDREATRTRLDVYVEAGCWLCHRARALADHVKLAHPEVLVSVIDVGTADARPTALVATPTFLLNGKVLSLGNPSREELDRAILGREMNR